MNRFVHQQSYDLHHTEDREGTGDTRPFSGRLRSLSAVAALVLLSGAGMVYWTVEQTDRRMRHGLLLQTRLVAEAVNAAHIQALAGSQVDLDKPEYLRLKEQFAAVKQSDEKYRFVYLMGRKDDGRLFFFVDNEPVGSEDESPAGMIYDDAPEGFLQVMATGVPAVEGPFSDRWGDFVSGCVPVTDQAGTIMAILAVDFDASAWKRDLAHAAIPAILSTLVILAIIFGGAAVSFRRSRSAETAPRWMKYLETAQVGALGLVLTLLAAWTAHRHERYARQEIFAQLAASRTLAIAESLRDLRDIELEGLGRFYEGSDDVTPTEFAQYSEFLTKNPMVQVWEWIPEVSATEKRRFEEAARGAGLEDFEIWQWDEGGKRVPAAGRETYYPVLYANPLGDNQAALGYDLGSEPRLRGAIEDAARTGLFTSSDPITPIQGPADQTWMLIIRPVFESAESESLRGFVLAGLRLESLRGSAGSTISTANLDIALLLPGGAVEPLVAARNTETAARKGFSLTRQVFAFDKVFALTARANAEFLQLHPVRAGRLVVVTGITLSAALAFVLGMIRRRRTALEQLVAERTLKLSESEERHRVFFVQSKDAIMTLEPPTWKFTSANPAMVRMFRAQDTEEYVSLDPSKLSPERQPDGRLSSEKSREMIETAVREGFHHFEWVHRRLDGTDFPSAVTLSRMQLAGRIFLQAVVRDITAQKQAEEALRAGEARMRAITESAQDAIIMMDPAGRISFWNPAAERIFGYKQEEVIGQYLHRLLAPERYQDSHREAFVRFRDTGNGAAVGKTVELEGRHKEGHEISVELSLSAIELTDGWHAVGIMRDITDRKRAEAALKATNQELETQRQELEAVNEKLAEAKAQAEMASIAKSEFLANMSHEIRTPMTAILGYADLISECCPGQCTYGQGELRQSIETIQRNGRHLLEIINDILDLTKIEADKIALGICPCSPRRIASEVESLVSIKAKSKDLAFEIEFIGPIPQTIQTDPLRLRQILVNLVGNAVKFTESGSVILEVRLANDPDQARLEFDVIDTGIGLTDEQSARIFRAFGQADASTTRQFGGTGLGLVISKRLAQLLGGDVLLVSSKPGLGSRFRASVAVGSLAGVPMIDGMSGEKELFANAEAGMIIPPAEAKTALKGLRILLAEDGLDNQRLIMHVLKKAGAEVNGVENGRQAVEAAMGGTEDRASCDSAILYDVILMDMQMPELDGYAATALLREKGYVGPIIALTAHSMAGDRQKCLDAGCDDFASKPIDLMNLIETILRHARNDASGRSRSREQRSDPPSAESAAESSAGKPSQNT